MIRTVTSQGVQHFTLRIWRAEKVLGIKFAKCEKAHVMLCVNLGTETGRLTHGDSDLTIHDLRHHTSDRNRETVQHSEVYINSDHDRAMTTIANPTLFHLDYY